MLNIFFSFFLLCGTAAYAQEAVKTAATESQAAPAQQQNKYAPEILQAIKNLTVLAERSSEIPQAKLDALAPEIAVFNHKVKAALGSEILADIARKEKDQDDRIRSAKAKRTLQSFRAALQVYYGDKGGAYPKSPELMVPKEIQAVPEIRLPEHEPSSKIRIIDSKKYDKDYSKAVSDSGGWLYFSSRDSDNYGLLLLDCSHKEAGGAEFFRY